MTWDLAIHVSFYAAFPIASVAVRPPLRHVLLYVYVGAVLTVGGFLGALYAIPVTDDIVVSAGSLAYGAFMLTTFIAVIVAQEAKVVRHILAILVVLNVFKYGLYTLTARGIDENAFLHRVVVDSEVFRSSLRVVALGGVVIALELLLLLGLTEVAKRRQSSALFPPVAYTAIFAAILIVDGALFPAVVFPFDDSLGSIISSGVRSKVVLAAYYSAALACFLALNRSSVRRFHATPLSMFDFVFRHGRDVFASLEQSRTDLANSQLALESTTEEVERQRRFTAALSSIDRGDGSLTSVRRGIAAALRGLSDRYTGQLGVLVVHQGVVVGAFGASATLREESYYVIERTSSQSAWIDQQRPTPAALLALTEGDVLMGIVEIELHAPATDKDLDNLQAIESVLANLLLPAVHEAQRRWGERAPIQKILGQRAIDIQFQPIVELSSGHPVAYEALSRFEFGTDPESRFKEATRLGLGTELDLLAIRSALDAARALPDAVPVSVNTSQATLGTDALVELVRNAGRPIVLELSEHEMIEDYAAVSTAARRTGAQLAVDDAGSGFASLRHIVRLRPDVVKIDRSWVTDIETDRPRQVLLEGLLRFADEIGASLVAEGIETRAEADELTRLGIQRGQGHLFGEPMPVSRIIG